MDKLKEFFLKNNYLALKITAGVVAVGIAATAITVIATSGKGQETGAGDKGSSAIETTMDIVENDSTLDTSAENQETSATDITSSSEEESTTLVAESTTSEEATIEEPSTEQEESTTPETHIVYANTYRVTVYEKYVMTKNVKWDIIPKVSCDKCLEKEVL